MTAKTFGTKRIVVGAHYGFKDWLAQRATAVIMAVYTVVLLVAFLLSSGVSYERWAKLYAFLPMKLLTLTVFIAFGYHAWVGMRDIWMDYIKPVALRISLQTLTLLWLVAMVAWAIAVLWRV
jgi:succinate dehydrogenase / fumarate reductase, membrane anchor subunit